MLNLAMAPSPSLLFRALRCSDVSLASVRRSAAWLLLGALWSGGCGDPSPGPADGAAIEGGPGLDSGPPLEGGSANGEPCGTQGTPAITLGTGVARFETLRPNGATLELVRGPQGGFHVYGAVRMARLDPDGAELRYEVRRQDDGTTLTLERRVRLSRRRIQLRSGMCQFRLGDLLIFDPDRFGEPADVEGLQVAVSATLSTPDGTVHQDEHVVRLVDEEPDPTF